MIQLEMQTQVEVKKWLDCAAHSPALSSKFGNPSPNIGNQPDGENIPMSIGFVPIRPVQHGSSIKSNNHNSPFGNCDDSCYFSTFLVLTNDQIGSPQVPTEPLLPTHWQKHQGLDHWLIRFIHMQCYD